MKGILKIFVAVVVAGIVIIVGFLALLGFGIDEGEKERQAAGITQAEFKSLENGQTLKAVKKQYGKPEDEQVTEHKGLPRSVCIYYPVKGGEDFESYQICFDDGKLTSKAKY